jgi:Flp pilus assembly pilin Flp
MRSKGRTHRGDESGATAVEFAVLLVLLALALIAGVSAYGSQLGPVFASTAAEVELIGNGSGTGSPPQGGPPEAPVTGPPASGGGPGQGGPPFPRPGQGCENGRPPNCT